MDTPKDDTADRRLAPVGVLHRWRLVLSHPEWTHKTKTAWTHEEPKLESMQAKAREYGCTIKVEEERGRYVETHEGYTLPRWVPENDGTERPPTKNL